MTEAPSPEQEVTAARVLIVDDEPTIRQTLARALSLRGYQTDEAGSGPRALALLEQRPYDLMVLDMIMPGMDGVKVMHLARQLRPDLLIVVLTGHASLESAIAAVKQDAVDYLLKPTSIHDIAAAVSRALKNRAEEVRRERLVRVALDALRQAEMGSVAEGNAPASEKPLPTEALPEVSLGEIREQHFKVENLPERFLQAGPLLLDRHKRLVVVKRIPERALELSEGEEAILAHLMSHPDQVVSCQELARAAWGYTLSEQEAQSLVRPHIFRMRRKIESTPDDPSLIRTIRGRGYLFSPV